MLMMLRPIVLKVSSIDSSLKTEANLKVATQIPVEKLLIETDAPWCDMRQTHASFKYIKTVMPTTKPQKFKLGTMVKGRNEPCAIMYVLLYLIYLKILSCQFLSPFNFV